MHLVPVRESEENERSSQDVYCRFMSYGRPRDPERDRGSFFEKEAQLFKGGLSENWSGAEWKDKVIEDMALGPVIASCRVPVVELSCRVRYESFAVVDYTDMRVLWNNWMDSIHLSKRHCKPLEISITIYDQVERDEDDEAFRAARKRLIEKFDRLERELSDVRSFSFKGDVDLANFLVWLMSFDCPNNNSPVGEPEKMDLFEKNRLPAIGASVAEWMKLSELHYEQVARVWSSVDFCLALATSKGLCGGASTALGDLFHYHNKDPYKDHCFTFDRLRYIIRALRPHDQLGLIANFVRLRSTLLETMTYLPELPSEWFESILRICPSALEHFPQEYVDARRWRNGGRAS